MKSENDDKEIVAQHIYTYYHNKRKKLLWETTQPKKKRQEKHAYVSKTWKIVAILMVVVTIFG